jgi:hypothetical protein
MRDGEFHRAIKQVADPFAMQKRTPVAPRRSADRDRAVGEMLVDALLTLGEC